MTTRSLEERFTASEALKFVEDHILGGPVELLDQPLELYDKTRSIFWDLDKHDKWADLPADFVGIKLQNHDIMIWFYVRCKRVRGAYEVIKFFRSVYRSFWQLFCS